MNKWLNQRLVMMEAKSPQLCPALRDPMDCSPPGSCVHGVLQARYWSGLPCHPPGDLPDPGMEPVLSQLFASGGQTIGALDSAPVLPINIQD